MRSYLSRNQMRDAFFLNRQDAKAAKKNKLKRKELLY